MSEPDIMERLTRWRDNFALTEHGQLSVEGAIIEITRLRFRVAELEADNKRMRDFICSLDGMNAGHMHDGAIDDEIAIVASDFKPICQSDERDQG